MLQKLVRKSMDRRRQAIHKFRSAQASWLLTNMSIDYRCRRIIIVRSFLPAAEVISSLQEIHINGIDSHHKTGIQLQTTNVVGLQFSRQKNAYFETFFFRRYIIAYEYRECLMIWMLSASLKKCVKTVRKEKFDTIFSL
jgi:hypothetical protein